MGVPTSRHVPDVGNTSAAEGARAGSNRRTLGHRWPRGRHRQAQEQGKRKKHICTAWATRLWQTAVPSPTVDLLWLI